MDEDLDVDGSLAELLMPKMLQMLKVLWPLSHHQMFESNLALSNAIIYLGAELKTRTRSSP